LETITIISGSNRDNNTKKVALEYQRLLKDKNIDTLLLALDEKKIFERDSFFINMENEFLKPAQKFIIIMPEYNGSYPGILKLMIDNTEVSKVWWHKKVLLTGVSTGRAGNLRGMDHLTGSLLHIKMLVHPNRLPISVIDRLLDSSNQFSDAGTLRAIDVQLEEFLNF
jgi:chromate reductase, NAD(P)H dehydrogenase (quinone)